MSNDQTIQENEKSLWEKFTDAASDALNKGLLVREGAQNFVAGIPAIPGYLVDLVDMGSEKLGYDLYEGSAGRYIQEGAKSWIDKTDPVKILGAGPEIRNETDQNIVDYTETTMDVASVVLTLGAATPKLAATGSKILAKSSDNIASAAARNADDVAEATAKTATRTADDAAEATAKTASHTADDAAEAGAKATSEGAAISATDRLVLRSGKIGLFSSIGVSSAIATEYATGGAISSVSAEALLAVADAIRDIDPELADAIKDGGLSVLALGTGLADTPESAAVNMGSIALEDQGYSDAATAVRIGHTVSSVSFYTDLMATDEGERTDRFITKLSEEANVERSQIGEYLKNHPMQTGLIQEQFGIDLSEHFPELAEADATASSTINQTQQATTRNNPLGSFAEADIDALNGRSLSNMFSQATDMATDMNMDLGWQFNIYTAAVGFLSAINIFGWADDLIEGLQRHAIDMVQDEVVNQGENFFGVTDTREFEQENAPRPTPTGPQPAAAM